MTRQVLDRTALQGECIELFRAAIKSPHTRDPYERRVLNFLNYVKILPGEFVTLGRNNPSLVEKKVIAFIAVQKARIENAIIYVTQKQEQIDALHKLDDRIETM